MLEAALAYAQAGIPIFPLSGKQPLEKAGTTNVDGIIIPEGKGGFHQATADPGKVERWWLAYPDANIGMPTGNHLDSVTGERNASPVDVLDIDTDHGGVDSLRVLLQANAPLPDTPHQITGSGGYHYLFSSDGSVRNSAGGIAPGIDVRGTGGYIVVAPSLHPTTGLPYEWQAALADVALAPWPDWLLSTIREVSRKRNGAHPGQRIPMGIQEATLMRVAGAMRRQGSTESEIMAALRVISQERCDPPLAETNLERMARSVSSYAPGDDLLDIPLDDSGNAERLVRRYGANIRHVEDAKAQTGGWYVCGGRTWEESTSKVIQHQLETARAYMDAVEDLPLATQDDVAIRAAQSRNAKNCAQERGMLSARKLAATFPEIEIKRSELDADPWSFALQNGVLDLKTGTLRPHDPSELITRISPVVYQEGARSQLWEDFLHWFTDGDTDLQAFLQLAAGYTMSADTREEVLFFIHGKAQSGKTTFIESIKAMMGGYALTADFSTFIKGHNVGGPRPDIARLAGARYVSSIEVDQGKTLAEGLIKQMTGGDTVTARFLYGTDFEYQSTHKLWLVANDAPKVNAEDDGLWRRILRIPCNHVIPMEKRDPAVKMNLKDPAISGPAIVSWMLEGCLAWQRAGKLQVPATITDATAEYRESQDPITDFVKESCEEGSDLSVAFADLWAAYLMYSKQYHRTPMGKLTFSERLKVRGFGRGRSGTERKVTGLALAASDFN